METGTLKNLKKLLDARSSLTSLGTVSKEGKVNMAPVGSVFVWDDGTITLLRGLLNRSYKNLKENADAVIMVVSNSPWKWIKYFFTGSRTLVGYRLDVKVKAERVVTATDLEPFKKRFGMFTKTKGWTKIRKSLDKVITFEIQNVREITLGK